MEYLVLIFIIIAGYPLYKFLPIYIKFKKEGTKIVANVVDKKAFGKGVLPILTYTYEGVEYQNIMPIESSLSTKESFFLGKTIEIYVDKENPEICVVNSDYYIIFNILLVVLSAILFIYIILYGTN